MSEWCIVAIPEEDCSVWRESSEKVPHMTLLFLGEQDDPEKAMEIATFLQHAAKSSLTKFSMGVKERGTLGDKDADVLFFDQKTMSKQLTEFRSFLLQDATIRSCYDSAEQYPSWTPHLTMGYPDKPAKKMSEGYYNIQNVFFDRIALWIKDSEGPSFELGWERSDYSDPGDVSLAHHGIKGMKWGVRRKAGSDGTVGGAGGGGSASGGGGGGGAGGGAESPMAGLRQKVGTKQKIKESYAKPMTEDAKDAAAGRKRSGQHGTDALSNKELKALVERMNLEQQYANLQASGKAATARESGKTYVSQFLKSNLDVLAGQAFQWAVAEGVKYAFNQARGGNGGGSPTQANAVRLAPLAIEAARRALTR